MFGLDIPADFSYNGKINYIQMDTGSFSKLMGKKKEVKEALAKNYSFSKTKPLLAIILDHELSPKEEKQVHTFLDAVSNLDLEVVVLTDSNLDSMHLPNVIYLPYSRKNRNEVLGAADMSLVFDFSDVEEMHLNGVIPISSKRKNLLDYNPSRETGNGFIYKKDSPWAIFEALVRARETFKLPYDWKHIVREGMKSV